MLLIGVNEIINLYWLIGVPVKVFVVNTTTEKIESKLALHIDLVLTTVGELKTMLAQRLGCDAEKLCLVLDARSDFRRLSDPDRGLRTVGISASANKVSYSAC
jgi:hypothetical protein